VLKVGNLGGPKCERQRLAAVQAYVYHRQWETMAHQWLVMKEQMDIKRNALTENRDIFYIG
jgi:hypothetical protein